MSGTVLTLIIFAALVIFLFSGLPVAFVLGGVGVVFVFFYLGADSFYGIASRSWELTTSFVLICLPLFIFMGVMLEQSGIANDLFKMMHKWGGRIPGSLASGTVVICMMFAAMTGVSGPATVTMGLVALPEMLKRGYDKDIALGSITAGGALGILIPPSITMVMYAIVSDASIGKLFIGGIIPGALLGLIFIAYITLRCTLQPHLGPGLPQEARSTWLEKIVSLRMVILPMAIIFAVLGSIFLGIATPTEAAAVGALGTMVCAAIYRRLKWPVLKQACYQTLIVTAMAIWLAWGAKAFTSAYIAVGAPKIVEDILLNAPGGKWGVILTIQFTWIILGMLIDPLSILMITGPLYVPVVSALGFDLVWFGVIFVVNMEMAYLTPPFGMNLFYLKGVAPKSISMGDIIHSTWPFVMCQLAALALMMVFPQIILWLPNLMK